MWTSEIIDKQLINGKRALTVKFLSGASSQIAVEQFGAQEDFQDWVQVRSEFYQKNEEALAAFAVGTVAITPDTPIVVATSAADIWYGKYKSWMRIKRLIDEGILTGQEDWVLTEKKDVQGTFNKDFIAITGA